MDYLKQLLESYLEIPPTGPGQGTAWNLRWSAPWPAWLPDWFVLLLGTTIIFLLIYAYLKDTIHLDLPKRAVLLGIRLTLFVIVLLFLTKITLSIHRTGLPFIALLIDDSASMGLEDDYTQSDAKNFKAKAQQFGQGKNRLDLVKSVLLQNDAQFLSLLQKKHKLRLYHFSEACIPFGEQGLLEKTNSEQTREIINQIEPMGKETRLFQAVQKVLNDFRGTPPTAIIVFTDGISSTGEMELLSRASALAKSKLVPIFPVGVGSEQPVKDLQLYDLLVDDVAFVDDPINLSAKVKYFGINSGSISVALKDVKTDKYLATRQFPINPKKESQKIELTFTPTKPGLFEFVLEVKPVKGEVNQKNNQQVGQISVLDQKIRVLLVDSVPRYEYRYLKHLLERDKTIELRSILQESDLEYSSEDATALDYFPVKKEDLYQYDVVILGDVDPAYFSQAVFENLDQFVREKGGGLVVVAGPRFSPQAYANTKLEALLPIELFETNQTTDHAPVNEGFQPELTSEGQYNTSIFRFADSAEKSRTIWNNLPELYWFYTAKDIKPGASVFATHPTQKGKNGQLIPIIATQRVGAGKVLFSATDDLWRWRDLVGDLYYSRFWVQAIRYLSRSKLLNQEQAVELTLDRKVYQQGDTVQIRVKFLNERQLPTDLKNVTVMLERQGDASRPVKLSQLEKSPNVFEGSYSNITEGAYHAWVSQPILQGTPPAEDFRVEASQRELLIRDMNQSDMQKTAKETRGKYFHIFTADKLPQSIPTGHPVPLENEEPIPLWNRWEFLILFTLLITAEWLLRKRFRLV
ncbi:MAG: VWA domain-containing protein [Gimesia sp.]